MVQLALGRYFVEKDPIIVGFQVEKIPLAQPDQLKLEQKSCGDRV